MIVAALLLACSAAPQPVVPVEPPPFVAVAHAPPARPLPDLRPADRSLFTVGADGLGTFDEGVGTGPPLAGGDVAVAEITSFTLDGAVWDSTRERPDPARFVVGSGEVVKGWDRGVVGMQVGGVRQLLVPAELGFAHGIAGRLPAGPTVTRVELLAILVPPVSPVTDGAMIEVGGYTVRDVRLGAEGPGLSVGDTARFDYVAWLADGTRFDDSFRRPAPYTVRYGEGRYRLEAALEGMRPGGRRQIEVPPELAFGSEGRAPVIPPGATLVFSVDLHPIE